MSVIKLIIFWLSVTECLAKISEISKTSESASLIDATVEILSSCYHKEPSVVGLAGNSDGVLFETLCSKQYLQVAIIGNDTSDAPVDPKSRQKLQIFVVTASYSTELNHTLEKVNRSQWWNHMATFLIIDQHSNSNNGCSNAYSFLWTAWQKNLINALYVCHHQTKGRLIYSFNPYTSRAPYPWQWENTFRGKNDHPWTLLQREYDSDERICVNLKFDKTSDLGGYKIYSSLKELPPGWIIDPNKTGINSYGGYDGRLVRVIFQALNATPHLIMHDLQIPGLNDRMGNDMAMDTVTGISEIMLITRLYPVVLNYTVSQVFAESEMCIVTQYSGQQSQLNKLLTVLDRSSRFGLCLVVIVTVIFFKCFLRQPIGLAVLNVVRIATNSSLTKVSNNQAARLYLAGIFILVVTIIGIYQGKMASLLTKPKALPNVETIMDLADRTGYIIHGHKTYAHLFTDPAFKGRFIEHEDYECARYVERDPSAACVQDILDVTDKAAEKNLHLSREPAMKVFAVFVIQKDWPIEERFNKVLAALVESDMIIRLTMGEALNKPNIAKFHETEAQKEKFRVIVLTDLTFAFAILGIGLGCATVCFIVEIAVSQFCWKKRH